MELILNIAHLNAYDFGKYNKYNSMTYTRGIRRARKSVDASTLGNSSDLESSDMNETKKGRRHKIKKTNKRSHKGREIASKSKRL